MSMRREKISGIIKNLAAEFLSREADTTSLITVTKADISSNSRNSTIFLTVYPEDKEEIALAFLKRKRSDFREYVNSHAKMKYIPLFDFAIDIGEKNRQRIEEISSNSENE